MKHTTKERDCAQEKDVIRAIGLRLPESEYRKVEAMAKADDRSIGAMARILVRRAMDELAAAGEAAS